MRYRCYCRVREYFYLTKEEVRAMLRSPNRFEVGEFAEYYGIPLTRVRSFLKDRGINLTRKDRESLLAYERKVKGVDANGRRIIKPRIEFDVSEWPRSLVYALGNVSFETIKGKRAYDTEEYQRAVESLQGKINNYFKDEGKEEEKFTDLKTNDLIAMRYYRGYNRKKFARKANCSVSDVVRMEKTSPVPKSVADLYKRVLNIKNAHIAQLRKVMKGQLNNVEDDRTIPTGTKVKVFGRDKGQCRECGSKEHLHYHHIIHHAEGGQNTVENLKLLCVACHAEAHKGEHVYHMLKSMADKLKSE